MNDSFNLYDEKPKRPRRKSVEIGKRPIQMISFKDKIKNDYDWWKDCTDYYVGNIYATNKSEMLEHYDWYNNIIKKELFYKVENPFNSTDDKYTNFPADIRPFDIVRTVVDLFIGEYRQRGFAYQVNINNPDAHSKMLEQFDNRIAQLLRDVYVQEIEKQGGQANAEPKELSEEDLALLEKGYDENYKDERAIEGQYALDYLTQSINLDHQLAKGMLHWCVAGIICTLKNVVREEVEYEIINPIEIHFDNTVEFIEDGEFCSRLVYMTPSEVIAKYYDELTEDDIRDIETKGSSRGSSFLGVMNYNQAKNDIFNLARVQVAHTTWKSLRKVGILTTLDEYGQEVKTEVDETYKLDPIEKMNGATLEFYWVNEVLEGTRINGDIYVRMRPVPCQRNMMNNLSACKLPYNGRAFSNVNSLNTSIVKLARPYAILYILTFYTFEMTLAKNGGKVVMIDKTHIPKDWELDKFMYYGKALGYNFIDTQQAGASKTFNQYSVLDLNTLQQCVDLLSTANTIKQEMYGLFGITPQRMGNVSQSSAVGTTEKAVFQSSVISEQTFALYDEFVQKELQGLLDCSKLAWLNGKKAMFIGNDQRTAILDIDPENYVSYDFGVIATNRQKDRDVLESMRTVIQPMAQNGSAPSTILNVLEAKNVSKLREYLEIIEEKNKKMAEQQQKGEAEQQQQLQQMQMEMTAQLEKLKSEIRIQEMQVKHEMDKELEMIKGSYKSLQGAGVDSDANGVVDALEIEKVNLDREIANNANIDANRKMALAERQQQIDAQLKIAELNTKMATEKLKAKTALKNKTSGEK